MTSRRYLLPTLFATLCWSACSFAADVGATASLKAQGEWMAHFYEHPEPEHLPQWINEVVASGGLEKKSARFPIMVFVSEVARGNPAKVAGWCKAINQLSGEHRASMAWAFKNAGVLDESCLVDLSESDLSRLRAAKPYQPLATAPKSPMDLDMLWAVFMATGNEQAINLIVDVLGRSLPGKGEPGAVESLLLHGAAKWSLAANAQQHVRVRQLLEARLRESQGLLREQLASILEKPRS